MSDWYYAQGREQKGPMSEAALRKLIDDGTVTPESLLFGPGMMNWTKMRHLPQFAQKSVGSADFAPPRPPRVGQAAHEIDYTIVGEEMQFVEVELDPGESAVAEAGSMMYMGEHIAMSTVFGDGSHNDNEGGFMGKLLGAGKRLVTGESLFTTVFTHAGPVGKQHVAFAAPYPGKIIPVDLSMMGGTLICQKDAFLAAARGVAISVHFQKKIGVGLFGGEGFIMQKLDGDGMAFVHAGGTIIERELAAGEKLRVDTGCLVALMPSVQYDVEFVGSIKSAVFGGEGFFYAALKGPGKVWLQSLPFSRLAGRIHAAAPQTGGKRVGEGSVLGGLGDIVMGD